MTNDYWNIKKYSQFNPIELVDRNWPNKVINKAPIWCSVDLRDGNQALIEPMGQGRKKSFFLKLVSMGYKEIEVGFPSASQTDYDFVRMLIEENLIPKDVTIQVLVQARKHLIERTFEAIKGCKNVIVHLYNSTSTLQRKVVFCKDKQGVKDLALEGAKLVKELSKKIIDSNTNIRFEYSPESFSQTELPYALDICENVCDIFGATKKNPVIINLPATVEASTPNIHADQIEWMSKNFSDRSRVILSLHPHNDRGTGVAATELGLLAGADRIEGTLFGNGERTGNVCLVTLGMNLYSQGIDPEIDFSNMPEIIKTVEYCNQMPVPERHPYGGLLVFTAFSGSHQDAINKGLKAIKKNNSNKWEVPYLPIDPRDIGRTYETVIRINSQSGKGGIAYLMEKDYGMKLPKNMQINFSSIMQKISDKTGKEQSAEIIYNHFIENYLKTNGYEYVAHFTSSVSHASEVVKIEVILLNNDKQYSLTGRGTGPLDGVLAALNLKNTTKARIKDYSEHSIGMGSDAKAISYIEIEDNKENVAFGSAVDKNITIASIKALLNAYNNLIDC